MFKCYHCGDDLRWNNDYDAEDDAPDIDIFF